MSSVPAGYTAALIAQQRVSWRGRALSCHRTMTQAIETDRDAGTGRPRNIPALSGCMSITLKSVLSRDVVAKASVSNLDDGTRIQDLRSGV